MKNIFKNLSISLITTIFVVIIGYGGYTKIYAQSEQFYGFPIVQASYHMKMNNLFNDKFKKLNEILKDDQFAENPNFNPPENPDNCDKDNVSTYCVGIEALELYIAYLKNLEGIRGDIYIDYDNAGTISTVLNQLDISQDQIDTEISEARSVMEKTLSAYNEYRLAYPMHKRYNKIIKALLKYRLAIKNIRLRVAKFPEKFIDATSSTCK